VCTSSGELISEVSFHYHMRGADMGTLRLLDAAGSVKWARNGDQQAWDSLGNTWGWPHARKSVLSNSFRFEYLHGGGPLGDAAIAEVGVVCLGVPPPPPPAPPALPPACSTVVDMYESTSVAANASDASTGGCTRWLQDSLTGALSTNGGNLGSAAASCTTAWAQHNCTYTCCRYEHERQSLQCPYVNFFGAPTDHAYIEGTYEFSGFVNSRPYFFHASAGTSLYFTTDGIWQIGTDITAVKSTLKLNPHPPAPCKATSN
jgi:hypothetical protein